MIVYVLDTCFSYRIASKFSKARVIFDVITIQFLCESDGRIEKNTFRDHSIFFIFHFEMDISIVYIFVLTHWNTTTLYLFKKTKFFYTIFIDIIDDSSFSYIIISKEFNLGIPGLSTLKSRDFGNSGTKFSQSLDRETN